MAFGYSFCILYYLRCGVQAEQLNIATSFVVPYVNEMLQKGEPREVILYKVLAF